MHPLQPRRVLITVALGAMFVPGCNKPTDGVDGANALVSTTTLEAGDANCPGGGTMIQAGTDDGSGGGTAGNGVLEDGEVTSTQYVCDPPTALVKSTELPYGDADCPGGGVRIDTGLDDGSGGGTAGDGVLQDGEVTSSTITCDQNGLSVGSFDPPGGAEGTYRIRTGGGSATAVGSSGGDGGYFEVLLDYGSAGGHVKLFKTGAVDASFTSPAAPSAFDYGPVKVEVTSDVHVKPVMSLSNSTDAAGTALADGDVVELRCEGGAGPLYRWHSTSARDPISGIHVAPGGTLTFDFQGAAACEDENSLYHQITIDHAVVNEGTIATGRNASGSADSLKLYGGSFYGASGSHIDLRGVSKGAGTQGGDGGDLDLEAAQGSGYWGALWNHGTIDTSGGDGDDGGDAGALYLWAYSSLYNTGDLVARGGNAVTLSHATASTYGGSGAGIDVESGYGSTYNSGTVDTSGGKGSTGGGDGGHISVYGGDEGVGDLYNTGDLIARGGDADASCDSTECYGGDASYVYLYVYGNTFTSGNIDTRGGAGRAGGGGDGGHVDVRASYGYNDNTVDENTIPGGAVWVSGNIDTRGGDGATRGGDGGYVYAEGDPDYVPFGQEVTFLGYGGGVDTSGGDGALYGGDGGYTYFYQDDCAENDDACAWPAGSVINYLDIDSTGGDASAATGYGGEGGHAEWWTYYDNYAVGSYGSEKLINRGNVDTSGGDGGAGGGQSGYVLLYGLDGLDNGANFTANGGNATAPGGQGGDAGASSWSSVGYGIQLLADRGPVSNAGDLWARGGDSTATTGDGDGGEGGGVHLEGPTVTNSGVLVGDGGDANTTAGFGGDAWDVVLQSVQGTTTNSGSLSASGGAGSTGNEGHDAYTVIDGQLVP